MISNTSIFFFPRTSLLELILSEMKENNVLIGEEMATFLAVCFEEKCQSVLRLVSDTNDDKVKFSTLTLKGEL